MSTDPEPKGESDTISLQCVQTEYKLNYSVKAIWDG